MPIPPGKHSFGPDNGELLVHTSRTGAAAKAGHDLVIEVTSWSGTLSGEGEQAELSLQADGGSLRVREGRGGIQALGDEEKASIRQSIDEEVLKRKSIAFRSTSARSDGERIDVEGELELLGTTRPIAFALHVEDERLTGSATVRQSDWGIKPYSILFGTLKVADEVRVTFEATL